MVAPERDRTRCSRHPGDVSTLGACGRWYWRGWGHGSCCPLCHGGCVLGQIKKYEKLDSEEERAVQSRHIFDHYIMKELLACSHVSAMLCPPCGDRGGVPRVGWGSLAPGVFRGSSKTTTEPVVGATEPAIGMGVPP